MIPTTRHNKRFTAYRDVKGHLLRAQDFVIFRWHGKWSFGVIEDVDGHFYLTARKASGFSPRMESAKELFF